MLVMLQAAVLTARNLTSFVFMLAFSNPEVNLSDMLDNVDKSDAQPDPVYTETETNRKSWE